MCEVMGVLGSWLVHQAMMSSSGVAWDIQGRGPQHAAASPHPNPHVSRHRPSAAVTAIAQHGPFGSCWCHRRREAFETEMSLSPPLLPCPRCHCAWGSVATFRCRHHRTLGHASSMNEATRSPSAVRVRPHRPHCGLSSSSSSPSVTVGQSAYVDGGVVSCHVRQGKGEYSPGGPCTAPWLISPYLAIVSIMAQ